jgi:LPXTG-motif cell wall-anchored protein
MEVSMSRQVFRNRAIVIAALVLLATLPVLACPVCYGASDPQTNEGISAAVFSLLGITGAVLAGFVSLFVRMRNLARAMRPGQGQPSSLPPRG